MSNFIFQHMDQYATHVLAAYGIVSVCFGLMLGLSLMKWFRTRQEFERRDLERQKQMSETEKTGLKKHSVK